MAGSVGLAGLLSLLLQKAEGLADFGEIFDFHLQNSENEATLLALLRQSVTLLFVAKHQTHLRIFQLETSSSPG